MEFPHIEAGVAVLLKVGVVRTVSVVEVDDVQAPFEAVTVRV
jgi:hypothetical protein